MSKYANGFYDVINAEKYIGKKRPQYRSSWELVMMRFCDNNPAVLQWASEPFMIPYRNPLTGRNTVYVPDFMMVYVDKNSKKHAEVVEVKPRKEVTIESARSPRDRAFVVLNTAKWTAARAWCAQQGIQFRIVTEEDIFAGVKSTR